METSTADTQVPVAGKWNGTGTGMGYGIVAGVAAAFAANIVVTIAAAIDESLNIGTGTDAPTLVSYLIFFFVIGSIVAMTLGAAIGLVLGGIMGATNTYRWAPLAASLAAALLPLSILDENPVVAVAGVLLFAIIGYIAGRAFSKEMAASKRVASRAL